MTALERALQSILDEVDGKADASCEPGEERETPNIYMRIEMAADEAMAEAKRLSGLLSDIRNAALELPWYGWDEAVRNDRIPTDKARMERMARALGVELHAEAPK